MTVSIAVPTDDELTAEWFAGVMGEATGGAKVVGARVEPMVTADVGWFGRLLRAHLDYDVAGAGPATVVAKLDPEDDFVRDIGFDLGFFGPRSTSCPPRSRTATSASTTWCSTSTAAPSSTTAETVISSYRRQLAAHGTPQGDEEFQRAYQLGIIHFFLVGMLAFSTNPTRPTFVDWARRTSHALAEIDLDGLL